MQKYSSLFLMAKRLGITLCLTTIHIHFAATQPSKLSCIELNEFETLLAYKNGFAVLEDLYQIKVIDKEGNITRYDIDFSLEDCKIIGPSKTGVFLALKDLPKEEILLRFEKGIPANKNKRSKKFPQTSNIIVTDGGIFNIKNNHADFYAPYKEKNTRFLISRFYIGETFKDKLGFTHSKSMASSPNGHSVAFLQKHKKRIDCVVITGKKLHKIPNINQIQYVSDDGSTIFASYKKESNYKLAGDYRHAYQLIDTDESHTYNYTAFFKKSEKKFVELEECDNSYTNQLLIDLLHNQKIIVKNVCVTTTAQFFNQKIAYNMYILFKNQFCYLCTRHNCPSITHILKPNQASMQPHSAFSSMYDENYKNNSRVKCRNNNELAIFRLKEYVDTCLLKMGQAEKYQHYTPENILIDRETGNLVALIFNDTQNKFQLLFFEFKSPK